MDIALTFFGGLAFLYLLGQYIVADSSRKKRNYGTILSILTTAIAVYFLSPPSEKVKLGIDLQGGSSFVIQIKERIDEDGNVRAVTPDDVKQVEGILKNRLAVAITPDIVTKPLGVDRLAIEVPGINEKDRELARKLITETARLDFRLVSRDQVVKPGWITLPYLEKNDATTEKKASDRKIVVRARPDVSGDLITQASALPDPLKGWTIFLELAAEGAEKFREMSTNHLNHRFAIVVDDVVISSPVFKSVITGGECVIEGDFTEESARNLATSLNNPLRNPVEFVSSSEISATYGSNLIKQGLYAGVAGTLWTLLFMLIYYRMPGLFAVVALVFNILLLVGFMVLFNLTLTLAGIAGIVLTIGMSVDANVLIYERMREEIESGRDGVSAVRAAFEKAFSAIFDSNLTTLISCGIMWAMGSGALKSFAMSLTIGILTSLFAALVITRVCFLWLVESGKLRNLKTRSLIPSFYYDFLKWAKPSIILSLVLTVFSVGFIAFKGDRALGIDFRGGTLIDCNLKAGQTLTEDELIPIITGVTVQEKDAKGVDVRRGVGQWDVTHHSAGAGVSAVTVRTQAEDGVAVKDVLVEHFGDRFEAAPALIQVGAIFGKEMVTESIWALLMSIAGIFIYCALRFEFSFAFGTIVALIHDVILAAGVTVLCGFELSIIHVGALLTVAGYSVNDTIVVFDRIREMLVKRNFNGKHRIRAIMNEAICATMSRTLLTGGTTLLCILTLLFFGGPALRDFSLPLLVGILAGTYSTIFTAVPIALWWAHRGGRSLTAEIQIREDALRIDTEG